MVAYWTAYRGLTDAACTELAFPTLAVDTSAGEWSAYWQRVLTFLELPPTDERTITEREARNFVGRYRYEQGDTQGVVTIGFAHGELFVDGLPHTWPSNRLVQTSHNVFAVESLPFDLTFEGTSDGRVTRMVATGPRLLDGTLPGVFEKL